MKVLKEWLQKKEALDGFKKAVVLHQAHLEALIKKRVEIQPDIFEVIRFFLEENIDFYKSIYVLYKNGLYQSCLILGRSVMENSVNLRYILQSDTEKRAKNFLLHSTTSLIKRLETDQEEIPEKNELLEFLASKEQELNRSGDNKYLWDGKSFKQICAELGWEVMYTLWYTRLSKYVHSQYKGIRDLSEQRPYNDFMRKLITKDLLTIALQTIKDINEKYNLQEGYIVITDYPHENADMIFSFSSKEVDEKMSKL